MTHSLWNLCRKKASLPPSLVFCLHIQRTSLQVVEKGLDHTLVQVGAGSGRSLLGGTTQASAQKSPGHKESRPPLAALQYLADETYDRRRNQHPQVIQGVDTITCWIASCYYCSTCCGGIWQSQRQTHTKTKTNTNKNTNTKTHKNRLKQRPAG